MARAVIDFSEDISHLIPRISKTIKDVACNQDATVAGFRFEEFRIIVEKNRITIHGTDDEKTINRFLEWLAGEINNG